MCTTEFINDEFPVITCDGVGFVYELLQISRELPGLAPACHDATFIKI